MGRGEEKRPGDKCDNGRLDLESDRCEADVVQNKIQVCEKGLFNAIASCSYCNQVYLKMYED